MDRAHLSRGDITSKEMETAAKFGKAFENPRVERREFSREILIKIVVLNNDRSRTQFLRARKNSSNAGDGPATRFKSISQTIPITRCVEVRTRDSHRYTKKAASTAAFLLREFGGRSAENY